eukprot:gene10613-12552_t
MTLPEQQNVFKDRYVQAAEMKIQGDHKGAVKAYGECLALIGGDLREEELRNEEVGGNGMSIHLHNSIAETHLMTDDFESALEHYQSAAQIGRKVARNDNSDEKEGGTGEEANKQLAREEKNGDPEGAVESYESATEFCLAKDDCALAHKHLGMLFMQAAQHSRAAVALQNAVDYKPEIPRGYSNLALALQFLGKKSEAIEAFELAVDHEPNNPNVFANYGTLLASAQGRCHDSLHTVKVSVLSAGRGLDVQEGHYGPARQAFIDALELNPDHKDAQQKIKDVDILVAEHLMKAKDEPRAKSKSARYIGPTPKVPSVQPATLAATTCQLDSTLSILVVPLAADSAILGMSAHR